MVEIKDTVREILGSLSCKDLVVMTRQRRVRGGNPPEILTINREMEYLRPIVSETYRQVRRARESGDEDMSERIEQMLTPMRERYLALARQRATIQETPRCTACGSTATEMGYRQTGQHGGLAPMTHCIECGDVSILARN